MLKLRNVFQTRVHSGGRDQPGSVRNGWRNQGRFVKRDKKSQKGKHCSLQKSERLPAEEALEERQAHPRDGTGARADPFLLVLADEDKGEGSGN